MEPTKQGLLETLGKLMDKHPDMRLGQLVTNVAYWAAGPSKGAVWDVTSASSIRAAPAGTDEKESFGHQDG
ncbi:MAG: hypothetical protein GY862_04555 [Gammaproteobacteria bacterium]|nr:hypothetical protein [Gammaproteobacteria bacterium]